MKRLMLGLSAVLVAGLAGGSSCGSLAATEASACASAAHHQFDFWLGRWTVYDWTTHTFAGRNTVTSEFGGCVVQEHWIGSEGLQGSSFNVYDERRRLWHQTWVDSRGTLLVIEGGLVGKSMVLSGNGVGASGKRFRQRILWTPLDGGDVRQRWEVSRDGVTWKPVFDGRYSKS